MAYCHPPGSWSKSPSNHFHHSNLRLCSKTNGHKRFDEKSFQEQQDVEKEEGNEQYGEEEPVQLERQVQLELQVVQKQAVALHKKEGMTGLQDD